MRGIVETTVESAALAWLDGTGWAVAHGPNIAPDTSGADKPPERMAVPDAAGAVRIGTLTAGPEWFKPWRTIGGEELAPSFLTELQVMIEGAGE